MSHVPGSGTAEDAVKTTLSDRLKKALAVGSAPARAKQQIDE
jgi:hypothetical protein